MIYRNSARCLKCGNHIVSRHRHDWVSCKCGAIFTDGGCDYIHRGGNPEDFEDTSIIKDKDYEDTSAIYRMVDDGGKA